MEEILKEEKFLRTSDLSLVGVVQLYDYQIEALDRSNPEKIVFVIKRDDDLNKLIEAFWKRQLRVEPVAFFESLKLTKSRIYQ